MKDQELIEYAKLKFSVYNAISLYKDINILYKSRYNLFTKPLLSNHIIILYFDRFLINLIKFCNLFSFNDK